MLRLHRSTLPPRLLAGMRGACNRVQGPAMAGLVRQESADHRRKTQYIRYIASDLSSDHPTLHLLTTRFRERHLQHVSFYIQLAWLKWRRNGLNLNHMKGGRQNGHSKDIGCL